MLSQTTEYALRAAVWLGYRHPEPQTNEQIAAATLVPSGYLAKVLGTLSKAGVVGSQRGLRGGFTLSKTPEKLSALEVINAVEPIRRITHCPLGIPEHGTRLCPLHRKLDDAAASIERSFRGLTIAQLTSARSGSRPLCKDEGCSTASRTPARRTRGVTRRTKTN